MAVSGNYLSLYVGGQRIALTKSNDFSQKVATEDMTTKDSQGFKEVLPTLKEASCSMEGICTSNLTNLLQFPENFENAVWIKSTATISGTRTADLNDQLRAQVLTWNSDTVFRQNISGTFEIDQIMYFSVWLKGSGSVTLELGDDVGTDNSATITLTNNWKRYDLLHLMASTEGLYVSINKGSGTTLSLSMPQLELDNLTAYKGSTETLRDLQTIAENRTKVSLLYSDYFSGSFTTAYEGFLTDISIKNTHDTLSTFTCNFQSTGSTTITTI